ncbi:hypothetical protein VNO77_20875 [Canavalia gladiata]|uniref:Uncharacterized protein n=1 Tax=Canavalia gladiata TaxID=3824 RepID=A0AAN9LTK2_CANGL
MVACGSAWLVADTISEIIERMSLLHYFCNNITETMKHHLTTLKDICSGAPKLDLNDHVTGKWFGDVSSAVTELFYLVDDLCADSAMLQKHRTVASLFSASNLTSLHQLNQIEEKLGQLASESSLNKINMAANGDANSEEEEEEELMLKDFSKLNLDSWRLRQCFAYCSLIFSPFFTKKVETVIRLWMAEGFMGPVINSSPSSSEPEDLALECIKAFQDRRIFTDPEEGKIQLKYRMAEMAKRGAGNENLYVVDHDVKELEKEDVRNRVRRVNLDPNLDVSHMIPKPLLGKVKHMRTFLLSLDWEETSRLPYEVKLNCSARDAIFSTFTRLRVLTLVDLGLKSLPSSIGGLKSLRYLDLSSNTMRKLPSSIGRLKYLQTLLLAHCHELKKLPDGSNHFPSLRHLVLDQCLSLRCMPSALNKLTCLRTLSHFVASHSRGLGGLHRLNNLRGHLEISQLEQFKFKESKSSNPCFYVKHKHHLQCLTLRWNHENYKHYKTSSPQQDKDQIQLLSQLKPNPSLKTLSIIGYEGNQFPGWLPSLKNLVHISLYYCSNCKFLPSLHQIPNLEHLTLMSLDSLQFITNGDDSIKELPLKVVKISDCPNLTGWWEEGTQKNNLVFTSISELVLEYCPKLIHMPLFPALDDKLVLDSSNLKPLLDTLTHQYTVSDSSSPLSKLTQMTIINVDHQQYPPPPQGLLKNFTSLYHLHIRACEHLKSFTGWKNLSSLEELFISNCTEIDVPSEEWEGLENLSELVIEDIPDLENLPEGIKHLTSLNSLTIKRCPQLKDLTHHIHDLIHHQFQFLYIEDCPQLESLHLRRSDLIIMQITNCPSWLETQETDEEGPQDEKLVPPFSHLIH